MKTRSKAKRHSSHARHASHRHAPASAAKKSSIELAQEGTTVSRAGEGQNDQPAAAEAVEPAWKAQEHESPEA